MSKPGRQQERTNGCSSEQAENRVLLFQHHTIDPVDEANERLTLLMYQRLQRQLTTELIVAAGAPILTTQHPLKA